MGEESPVGPVRAIALVGPMGAGKTEVGTILAQRLSRPFVDTDALVERHAAATVAAIFEREGEAGFRALEAAAVREAAAIPGAVVACGGGVVLEAANVHVLHRAGVVVYLEVSPDVAARRVGDGGGRPLLAGGEPAARLARVIEQRRAAYEAAAHVVVDADPPASEVADAVLAGLEQVRPA